MDNLKVILILIIAIIVLIFGGIFLKVVFFPINSVEKSIDMTYDITDKTLDGENAIYNYEYFKKQEESIEALKNKEDTAKEVIVEFKDMYGKDGTKYDRETKVEYSRLSANVTALKNQLDDAIADYNAKSKMVNKNIFKDNLPTNISRAWYTSKKLRNGGN